MPRKRKPIYLRLAVGRKSTTIEDMIMSNELKTVKDYEGNEKTLTADPDKISSGTIVETFKVTVKTKDKETGEEKTHYTNDDEPFSWDKVENIYGVFTDHEISLSDEAMAFMAEVFKSEDKKVDKKNIEGLASLVEQHNGVKRANAKNNAYQKVVNKFTPQTAEDIEKAFNRMAETFSKQAGVTLEMAKTILRNAASSAKESSADSSEVEKVEEVA